MVTYKAVCSEHCKERGMLKNLKKNDQIWTPTPFALWPHLQRNHAPSPPTGSPKGTSIWLMACLWQSRETNWIPFLCWYRIKKRHEPVGSKGTAGMEGEVRIKSKRKTKNPGEFAEIIRELQASHQNRMVGLKQFWAVVCVCQRTSRPAMVGGGLSVWKNQQTFDKHNILSKSWGSGALRGPMTISERGGLQSLIHGCLQLVFLLRKTEIDLENEGTGWAMEGRPHSELCVHVPASRGFYMTLSKQLTF